MNRQLLINTKSYPNNFDFIRFVLASSVILCHSYVIFYGFDIFKKTEPFMVWSQQQISIGSAAVNFFFTISGFLIVKSFENSSSLKDYFKKRILRIYPGFIVAMLICYLIVGFLGSGWPINLSGYKEYIHYLHKKREFLQMITLQYPYQKDWLKGVPEPGLNDSVWTIQFEFICYLLVPVFALLGFFKRKIFFIIAFVVLYALYFIQDKGYIFDFNNKDYFILANPYHHPRFITYFLAGSCVYFYRDKIIRSHLLALISFVAIVLSFAWIKCADQVLPIAGTYLLFYLVYHPYIKLSNFAKYGDFSYGVYLYGWPVQGLIMYYFHDKLNVFWLCVASLPVAVLFAMLSWHFVEHPFLKLKKKKVQQTVTNVEPAVS